MSTINTRMIRSILCFLLVAAAATAAPAPVSAASIEQVAIDGFNLSSVSLSQQEVSVGFQTRENSVDISFDFEGEANWTSYSAHVSCRQFGADEMTQAMFQLEETGHRINVTHLRESTAYILCIVLSSPVQANSSRHCYEVMTKSKMGFRGLGDASYALLGTILVASVLLAGNLLLCTIIHLMVGKYRDSLKQLKQARLEAMYQSLPEISSVRNFALKANSSSPATTNSLLEGGFTSSWYGLNTLLTAESAHSGSTLNELPTDEISCHDNGYHNNIYATIDEDAEDALQDEEGFDKTMRNLINI